MNTSLLPRLLGCLGAGLLAASAFAQAPPPMPPGTTPSHYLLGTEFGNGNVVFNRFQWWDKVPPPTGPITGRFENEFCPPLARVVGDPTGAPAGFAVTSWVGWQSFYFFTSTIEFATRNDRPRSEPDFVRFAPDPNRPAVTALVNRYLGPLPLVLAGDNFRPPLWLDFERPQRAVGLEYGFVPLPDGNRPAMDGSAVHLIAYDRDGRVVTEARGGPGSIYRSNLANQVGVRSARGDIWSVQLLFERGSGENIQDQQALLRVWHEPLPLAAVKQGSLAVGSFNPGANFRGPLSLGAVQETLPFNCDRAVVLLRGFWLKYHDDASHNVGDVSVGFLDNNVRATTPGGSVAWTPTANFMRPLPGTSAPPTDAILYYTVLAWDSQQAELFANSARGTGSPGDDGRAFANALVLDPLGERAGFGASSDPATWRAQTEALRGHLFAGLGNFRFTSVADHDDIDEFRLGLGGYQVLGGEELYWDPAGPAAPALRNLFWPNVAKWTGDGTALLRWPSGSFRDSFQVTLSATLLAGRSLRSAADPAVGAEFNSRWTQGAFVVLTRSVGRRPVFSEMAVAPYWNSNWQETRVNRLAFPLVGEVAAVGLYEFGFLPGDPFREIEVEVHGANYDGCIVDWQQGRATVTNTIGSGPHPVIAQPTFAAVRRNAPFAKGRLQAVQGAAVNATYAKPWAGGGSSVTVPGIIRNVGDADVLITELLPSTTLPADRRFGLWNVLWRGQVLTADQFTARRPLQLRPGEDLQVGAVYFADPGWPRNSAPRQESSTMTVRTNYSPEITATLSMTASVRADDAAATLLAKDKNGLSSKQPYDFGRVSDSTGGALAVSAVLSDVGGVPLTVQSVSIHMPSVGYSVTTPSGLNPQPVPGQPNAPPQVEYKVFFQLGKGYLGVQKTDLVIETNAGRLKLPLRVEVAP